MSSLQRVACFIDGFNLYHAIDDLNAFSRGKSHHLKWLDLKQLAQGFIRPTIEEISAVHYFSAYAFWLPSAEARHKEYVAALESSGVTVKLGEFKNKERSCKRCNSKWIEHEEKQTDVNLALELLNRSWLKEFDRAIVITADTDIVPVLQMIKRDRPEIQLTAAIPHARFRNAISLRNACDTSIRIKESHLARSLFPEFVFSDGSVVATRPAKYLPPQPA